MPTVPENPTAAPRRLNFRKPEPRQPKKLAPELARAKRKGKPEKFKSAPQKRDRLPHGAEFRAKWDADQALWSGTLTVNGQEIDGEAGGVMTLLSVLDSKFRARAPKAG